MVNLRLISLKRCNHLMTLSTLDSSSNSSSSPFGTLKHLKFLDLGGASLDTIPDDVAKSKSKLLYLDLSCASISSLPSFFFQDTSNLKELFFLGCTLLESLPPSFTNLIGLETFSISESQIISFPIETFEQMPKLCYLNLINNRCLRSLPKLAGHASLKSFNLSGSSRITHLSLRACRSLEFLCLHDLEKLDEVDLSATAIKEFPLWVSKLYRLRRLDLLGLPRLRRLPWHKLQHIPEVLNLDKFERVGAYMLLTDSRVFASFTHKDCMHHVEEGGPLQSFYISVSPSMKRSKNDKNIDFIDQFQNKKHFYYKDIPLMARTFKQQFQPSSPLNRHVEISSPPNLHPIGLKGILQVTESLSVWDDAFVSSLTDLNDEFPELQECKLGHCHLIDSIFKANKTCQGKKLQTLWAFDLQKMTRVLDQLNSGQVFGWDEFESLKHVHLEHCPRLESIFPDYMILPSLETLTVLYCGNLRTVFYKLYGVYHENQFSRLHTIQLHELPKLSHLCENQGTLLRMQEWKELHFRGCGKLQGLPLLVGQRDQNKVHVDGEARQCKKLKAGMDEDQVSCYEFKSPPTLACFREWVNNKIFLK